MKAKSGWATLAVFLFSMGTAQAEIAHAKNIDSAALHVAALQQRLMVAGFTCGDAKAYNRFVNTYRSDLLRYDAALLAHFRARNAATGTGDYHAFKTRLANTAAIKSANDNEAFCRRADTEFHTALDKGGPARNAVLAASEHVSASRTQKALASDASPKPVWPPDDPPPFSIAPGAFAAAGAPVGQPPVAAPTEHVASNVLSGPSMEDSRPKARIREQRVLADNAMTMLPPKRPQFLVAPAAQVASNDLPVSKAQDVANPQIPEDLIFADNAADVQTPRPQRALEPSAFEARDESGARDVDTYGNRYANDDDDDFARDNTAADRPRRAGPRFAMRSPRRAGYHYFRGRNGDWHAEDRAGNQYVYDDDAGHWRSMDDVYAPERPDYDRPYYRRIAMPLYAERDGYGFYPPGY